VRLQLGVASTTEKKLSVIGVTFSRVNPALLNKVANSCAVRSLPPSVTIISRSIIGCGCPIGWPGDTTISIMEVPE
jgi:hypothetical protein